MTLLWNAARRRHPRSADNFRTWLARNSLTQLILYYLLIAALLAFGVGLCLHFAGPPSETPFSRVLDLWWYCFAFLHSYEPTSGGAAIGLSEVTSASFSARALLTLLAVFRLLLPALFFGTVVFKLLMSNRSMLVWREALLLRRMSGRVCLEACSYAATGLQIEDLKFRVFIRYERKQSYFPINTPEIYVGRELPYPYNLLPTRSASIPVEIIDGVDPSDVENWQSMPLVLQRSERGLRVLSILGEQRFTPDRLHLIVRMTGFLPQLDKSFSETHFFNLPNALQDRWSPRWQNSDLEVDPAIPVSSLNWVDFDRQPDPDRPEIRGLSIKEHVLDALIHTAGYPPRAADNEHVRSGLSVDTDSQAAQEWEIVRGDEFTQARPPVDASPDNWTLREDESAAASRPLLRQEIRFAPESRDAISAIMLKPADAAPDEPLPAVLCLHQTNKYGMYEPLGEVPPGDETSNPNMHYALELAQLGCLIIVVSYPNFNGYEPDCRSLGYHSVTMKGLWNHLRTVDLLCQRPDVDPTRIYCVGHSLGGTNSLFIAAVDERISGVICSAGFTAFSHYDSSRGYRELFGPNTDWYRKVGPLDSGGGALAYADEWERAENLAGWAREDKYMPFIKTRFEKRSDKMLFDFDDVIGAIAPRKICINAPIQDEVFQVAGVKCLEKSIKSHYAAANSSRNCLFQYPDSQHDWPHKEREEAFRFLLGD